MRRRLFLLGLLLAVSAFTLVMAPLAAAVALRNHASAGGRQMMTKTRLRLAAAGARIARGIRAVTAG
ncbi:MAG TPA: hypothetical protein VEJ20_04740 [Candidatus Eremiobacteraceae bacterium]|nr:hypothetical protein [Candidatus Eremiobacteraceae bacterium]